MKTTNGAWIKVYDEDGCACMVRKDRITAIRADATIVTQDGEVYDCGCCYTDAVEMITGIVAW